MPKTLQGLLDPLLAAAARYGSLDRVSGWLITLFVLFFGLSATLRRERRSFSSRLQVWCGRCAIAFGLYAFLAIPIRFIALFAAMLAEQWPALLAGAVALTVLGLALIAVNGADDPPPIATTESPESQPPAKPPRERAAEVERRLDDAVAAEAAAPKPATADERPFPKLPARSPITRERAAAIEKRLDEEAAREAADKYTRE